MEEDLPPNHLRMIALAEEEFHYLNDAEQIDFSENAVEAMTALHPLTLTERANEDGPYIWLAMIPVTRDLMIRFLKGEINERQLLEQSRPTDHFECIYLCSVLTLPEYRNKGLTYELAVETMQAFITRFEIKELFYWGFSNAGDGLAQKLAEAFQLPLSKKPDSPA